MSDKREMSDQRLAEIEARHGLKSLGYRATGDAWIDVYDLVAEVRRLREAQRWIPVSEALPEPVHDGASVLALAATTWGVWMCGYDYHLNEWFSPTGNQIGHVTHWMPLPELPKEKVDEE